MTTRIWNLSTSSASSWKIRCRHISLRRKEYRQHKTKRKGSGAMDFSLLSQGNGKTNMWKKSLNRPLVNKIHTWSTSAILSGSIMNRLKIHEVQFSTQTSWYALILKMPRATKKQKKERKNSPSSCKRSRRKSITLKSSKITSTSHSMSTCCRSQETPTIRNCKLPNTKTSTIWRWSTIYGGTRWQTAHNSWSLREIEHTSKGQRSRTSSFFPIRDVKLVSRRGKNKMPLQAMITTTSLISILDIVTTRHRTKA